MCWALSVFCVVYRSYQLQYISRFSYLYFRQAAQDLLSHMLVRDPERRLGSGELDAEEIKTHEFFKDMNWVELANARLPPPWRPEVAGSLDVSHFDTDFTTLPLGKRALTYPPM